MNTTIRSFGTAGVYVLRTGVLAGLVLILFYVLSGILVTFLVPLGVSFDWIGGLTAVLIGMFAHLYMPRRPFVWAALIASVVVLLPRPQWLSVGVFFCAFMAGFFLIPLGKRIPRTPRDPA